MSMNRNKKLVILGAGESGYGAAVLGRSKGYDVFISDMGTIKVEYRELLEKNNFRFEEGIHTEAEILAADEVIKSPGIPDKSPILKKLEREVFL